MSQLQPTPRRPGERLPSLALPSVSGGAPERLRGPAHDGRVLVLLPSPTARWHGYLATLAALSEIRSGYARLMAVVAGPEEAATALHGAVDARVEVLADAEGSLARWAGLPAERAGVVIADRYGQLYVMAVEEEGRGLPAAADVAGWVRFLAIQCPECGVADEPGYGEWAPT